MPIRPFIIPAISFAAGVGAAIGGLLALVQSDDHKIRQAMQIQSCIDAMLGEDRLANSRLELLKTRTDNLARLITVLHGKNAANAGVTLARARVVLDERISASA